MSRRPVSPRLDLPPLNANCAQIGVKSEDYWDKNHANRKNRWRNTEKRITKRQSRHRAQEVEIRKWREKMEARARIVNKGKGAFLKLRNMYTDEHVFRHDVANYPDALENAKQAVVNWRDNYGGRVGYEEELRRGVEERDNWQAYYDWKRLPPATRAPPDPIPLSDDELTEDEDY